MNILGTFNKAFSLARYFNRKLIIVFQGITMRAIAPISSLSFIQVKPSHKNGTIKP